MTVRYHAMVLFHHGVIQSRRLPIATNMGEISGIGTWLDG
jgi:hypothetical protein